MIQRILTHLPRYQKLYTRLLAGVLLVSISFGVLALATPTTAHAQAQPEVAVSTVDCDFSISGIFCQIGNALGAVINAISWLIGQLIQLFADGIIALIGYSARVVDMPAVTSGFQVTLNVVNLIFVMALIIIAFEIILGIHEGEAKKRLAKIILAALLVNFSLLIAGFLLDISNVFTAFFVKSVTSDNLRIALNPTQFRTLTQIAGPNPGGFFDAVAPALFGLFMSAIVLIILIAVFATVLVRILWVACLLLVMPLTWAFWVFPGMEQYHHDWWKNFIKWGVTIMPTMTFFLYIGIQTVRQMAAWTGTTPAAATTIQGTLNGIIQLFIIGGIMIAGLKIGQAAGGITASAALGAAGKAVGSLSKFPGTRGLGQTTAGAGASAIQRINRVPVLGALTSAIGGSRAANALAAASHRDHDVENYQKANLGSLADQQLFDFVARTDVQRAAKLAELSKRKKINDFMDPTENHGPSVTNARAEIAALVRASGEVSHKHGSSITDIAAVKDALESNPTLAPELIPGRTIAQQVQRTPPSKVADYSPSIFSGNGGDEVAQAILADNTKLRALVNQGSEATRTAFNTRMNNMLDAAITAPGDRARVDVIAGEIRDLNARIIEAKRNGNTADENTLRGNRLTLTTERNTIVAAAADPAAAGLLLRQRDTMNEVIDGRTTI